LGFCLGAGIGVAVAAAGAAETPAPALSDTTVKVIDKYVVPRFERFQTATAKLAGDLDAVCKGNGDADRLAKARKDFDKAVLSWAAIEFLRFGPMAVTGRPERISFWPDPRGFMQRQLSGLVAHGDPAAIAPGALAGKSAAIQGLPALESLLTAKPAITADGEDGRYRCSLAVAIARNLQGIGRDLVSEWGGETGWRARMLAPGPDNASYKLAAEPPAEFARALVTGLQMIQDRQLAPLMQPGAKASKKAPQPPFSAAKLSGRYAEAEIDSLKALYETMGLGRNLPEQKAWMPKWITQAWDRLADDAPAAIEKGPVPQSDADGERELRMVRFHVEGIRKLVGRELAPAAGLTIGFNELDGD
jgi:predicted lipoprotein